MKDIFYANGDSFVFGMECVADCDLSIENKELAFPKHLCELLGYNTYVNNAYCGATNDFIFRRTLFDIAEYEKKGVDLTSMFVLIGITSLHRIEIDADRFFEKIDPSHFKEMKSHIWYPREDADHGTYFVNPGTTFSIRDRKGNAVADAKAEVIPWATQYVWTEKVQMPAQEARILALHEILKAKNINHLFVNTVCPLERTTTDYVDYQGKNFFNITTSSFTNWAKQHYPTDQRRCAHWGPNTHNEYAKELCKHIQENIL